MSFTLSRIAVSFVAPRHAALCPKTAPVRIFQQALWSFAADDDDVSGFHRAVEDGFQRLLFTFEHDGLAFKAQAFLAGNCSDRAW